ncbi:MAG: hypothetical protein Q8O71_01620 [bacterium]|nr:hypothetical protein [bacterium]
MTVRPQDIGHGDGACSPPAGVRRILLFETPDYGVAAFVYPSGRWMLVNSHDRLLAEGQSKDAASAEAAARAWLGLGRA